MNKSWHNEIGNVVISAKIVPSSYCLFSHLTLGPSNYHQCLAASTALLSSLAMFSGVYVWPSQSCREDALRTPSTSSKTRRPMLPLVTAFWITPQPYENGFPLTFDQKVSIGSVNLKARDDNCGACPNIVAMIRQSLAFVWPVVVVATTAVFLVLSIWHDDDDRK